MPSHPAAGLRRAALFAVLGLTAADVAVAQTPPAEDQTAASETVAQEEQAEDELGSTGLEQLDLSRLIDPEVRTASLVAEPLSEAPAPVTVITSDMIEAIGARNLQEVLLAYVPGMTPVADKNELNIALRGIYTDSQQKMLILVNGHRINSRLFSSAAPDFSIGIHPSKILQIEVLRGPGSAIYGNLALNGVVNIVTKDADQMNDATIEVGAGSLGQRMLSGTAGQNLGENRSVTLWGSYFTQKGDIQPVPLDEAFNKIDDPDGVQYIGTFADPASYDVGGQFELGDFTLSLGSRQGKMVPQFTSADQIGGETYDYEEYRSWNGVGPGHMSRNTHVELAYDAAFGKWVAFHSGLYLDANTTVMRDVLNPRSLSGEDKLSTAIGWQERTIGNMSHLTLSYDTGAVGAGNFLVGGQIDSVKVIDSYWITGAGGDVKTVQGTQEQKVLPDGTETIYSAFTQLKHAFGLKEDVIFNVGVRYDYKDRNDYQYVNEFTMEDFPVGDDIYAISPRLALILAPESWFGVKFSFSDSFVDAPYFNRTNRTRNFRGTPTLAPEKMRAYQLTPTLRAFNDRFRNSTNIYYLEHTDIIFRDPNAETDETVFQNSGQLVIAGVEDEITYLAEDYRIYGAFSFQKPLHSTVYPVTDGRIDNVPLYFGSVTLDLKPLWWMSDDIWLGINGRYYSEQTSPYNYSLLVQRGGRGTPPVTRDFVAPDNRVEDVFLLRANLTWEEIAETNLYAMLTVDNILGATYYQGGTTAHPYEQQGRWILARVGYDFDL